VPGKVRWRKFWRARQGGKRKKKKGTLSKSPSPDGYYKVAENSSGRKKKESRELKGRKLRQIELST